MITVVNCELNMYATDSRDGFSCKMRKQAATQVDIIKILTIKTHNAVKTML
jgi:hypothetical protein